MQLFQRAIFASKGVPSGCSGYPEGRRPLSIAAGLAATISDPEGWNRCLVLGDNTKVEENARKFSAFIGVDLGGGKGKHTAVALLARRESRVAVKFVGTRSPRGHVLYDTELLSYLREQEDSVVALNAPLTPTVCVRCRLSVCVGLDACVDPVTRWFRGDGTALVRRGGSTANGKPAVTPYTQRACELVLQHRFGIVPREAFGQGTGPLTARAHYIRRALEGRYVLNKDLIEVYPKATIHQLFGARLARRYKREANTWRTRAAILEQLSEHLTFEVWREGCLNNDHCFDAVICAYTAYLWASEGWSMPGDNRDVFEADGWIWFPPARQ